MYLRNQDVRTVHLYVVPEEEYEEYSRGMWRIILVSLCVACVLLVIPSSRDISPWSLSLPLELLPVQTLTATALIAPTGTTVIPATSARGTLTVYNGSILAQELPKGFIVESSGGEFAMDETIAIPAGNPPSYGIARVHVHAVVAGQAGNIGAMSINAVYGTSLYLKNLAAFSGGADAYTEPVATDSDRRQALASARYKLHMQTARHMLSTPCAETQAINELSLSVTWSCQFVDYTVPSGLHVLSVQRDGDHVILEVQR